MSQNMGSQAGIAAFLSDPTHGDGKFEKEACVRVGMG
jgi:hypothetical protein